MGQIQSTNIPSKEVILAKTKGGTDLVNQLFSWMIQQTNIRDFYLMANPSQCKKYIMLTADVLNKVFYKIDVIPKAGPGGTIYFRKIDKLNPQDSSDPLYKHREINCLRLAFLYVRIFQVFAALSLTILDADPKMEMDLIRDISKLGQTELVPLFGQKQSGGGLNSRKPLPPGFQALRESLSEVPTNPSYYKFTGTSIYLEFRSQGIDGSLPIKYDFSAMKNGKKEQRIIEGRILLNQKSTDEIEIQLSGLQRTIGDVKKLLDDKKISFTRYSIEDIYRNQYSHSIPQELNILFQKYASLEYSGKDRNEDSMKRKDSPSITQFEKDMGEVAEGLHTKTIVSAFTRTTPPKAHCIARALQLVSDAGIQSQFPKEIYSHICKTKFMADTRSLPPSGERITKEDGIYALAQLFYDTLKEATPSISQATQEQYKAFLTKMKFIFEETKNSKVSLNSLKGNPLDSIVNKLPAASCSKDTVDKTFKIQNANLIRLIRNNVRQMVDYQINHTANATKILRKLFLLPIESGKPLQIHPNVLKGGMEEINSIAEEARNLLVDYYSQCEVLYRSGAEIIAANKALTTTI
jgi:hypothetical protein